MEAKKTAEERAKEILIIHVKKNLIPDSILSDFTINKYQNDRPYIVDAMIDFASQSNTNILQELEGKTKYQKYLIEALKVVEADGELRLCFTHRQAIMEFIKLNS